MWGGTESVGERHGEPGSGHAHVLGARISQWEKDRLCSMVQEKLGICLLKSESQPLPYSIHKVTLKWIIDLNAKVEV